MEKINMAAEVFKRYEKKYLLSQKQYDSIQDELHEYMKKDAYANYTICNIYYDTPNYDLIRTSLDKPLYKEKFRVRSYGVAGKEQTIFLELKKKYKGVVYKRRVEMSFTDAEDYLVHGIKPEQQTQIFREIDWFLQEVKPIPKVYLAYDRIAYSGKEDANLRLTFDTNIRFREDALNLSVGDYGKPLQVEKPFLMEIKIPGTMPLWMARLLSEQAIYPVSFSKYGTCYCTELIESIEGEVTYA